MAASGRRLLRRCGQAALATSLRGAPYASLVLCAADLDASPLLLLSDLAQHSRNIAFDPRISLLLDDAAGRPDPLAAPRLSVLGQAEATGDPRLLARFTARHPSSRAYAAFGDFRLYRVVVECGHLVAGFGRIAWIGGRDLLYADDASGLAAAEPTVLAALNKNRHTLGRCVERLLGRRGEGWQATGIDPEGLDIRYGDDTARLDFTVPLRTPEAVPAALAELLRRSGE